MESREQPWLIMKFFSIKQGPSSKNRLIPLSTVPARGDADNRKQEFRGDQAPQKLNDLACLW